MESTGAPEPEGPPAVPGGQRPVPRDPGADGEPERPPPDEDGPPPEPSPAEEPGPAEPPD